MKAKDMSRPQPVRLDDLKDQHRDAQICDIQICFQVLKIV